jgi:hypothetical protein
LPIALGSAGLPAHLKDLAGIRRSLGLEEAARYVGELLREVLDGAVYDR